MKRLVLKQILLIQEKVALGMGSARMKNFSSNVCFAAMHISRNRYEFSEKKRIEKRFQINTFDECALNSLKARLHAS